MAGAIARYLVARESEAIETEVVSAGLSAMEGSPATPEAIAAVGEMGLTLDDHRSRALSLELVRRSEVIYTMTESHLRGVLAIDPFANAFCIDPEGDIPDPIGGPLEEYRTTAQRIASALRGRLQELDP